MSTSLARESKVDTNLPSELFKDVVERIPEGILLLDEADDVVVYANRAAKSLLQAQGRIEGQPASGLLEEPGNAPSQSDGFRHSGDWRREFEIRRECDEPLQVDCWSSRIHIQGMTLRYVGIRDLSERRAMERNHQDLLESLSHDLKNPLAAIRTNAELALKRLGASNDDHKATDLLQNITESVDEMTSDLESLLEIFRLRVGAMIDLNLDDCDLLETIGEVVDEAQQSSETHVISIETIDSVVMFRCDHGRIRMVLRSLIANAIKYSPDGGTVVVAVHRADGSSPGVEISITDRGVGIPQNDIDNIFTRYYRAGNAGQIADGSGIGLAGARHVISAHGGTIDVQSKVGAGSTFTIQLPVMDIDG